MWYVGTSGYFFSDWIGTVYPEDIRKEQMLDYYVENYKFNALELNFTFYSIPKKNSLKSILKRCKTLKTAVKLHKSITHEKDLNSVKEFRNSLQVLENYESFIGYLAQFPYSFKYSQENADYIFKIRDSFGDIFSLKKVYFELRHKSWIEFIKNTKELNFVLIDIPKISLHLTFEDLYPIILTRKDEGVYFRFHGRNENWFQADEKTRYDYYYSEFELKNFAEALGKIDAKDYFVFFNNCYRGKALTNALQFREILGK